MINLMINYHFLILSNHHPLCQPPHNASHNLIQRIVRDFNYLLYFVEKKRREGRGGVGWGETGVCGNEM